MATTIKASHYSKIFWLESLKLSASEAIRYHIYGIFDYEILPNLQRLSIALQAIVNRNYNLRSNFDEQDGELIQYIAPHLHVEVSYYTAQTSLEAENLIQKVLQEPFNIQKGPLFRFGCITCAENQKFIFVPVFHHIIIDGTQFDTLMQEIGEHYHNLPNLNITDNNQIDLLKSYLLWETERVTNSEIKYWIDKIDDDYPLQINLPFQLSSALQPKSRVNAKLYLLDEALTEGVQKLSAEFGCSIFEVFKLAYALLISIYSDQDKLIIAYPVNMRRGGYKAVKGAFLNTCLFPFERKGTFRSCLKKEQFLKKNTNRHYTNIIDILSYYKEASFSCAISQADLANKGPVLESIPGFQFSIELGSTDLCLFLNTSDIGIKYGIIATWNLFEVSFLDQLSRHLCVILQNLIENPDGDLTSISCLTEDDYKLITHNWNPNPIKEDLFTNSINLLFEEQVKKSVNNIAIIYENQTFTYDEINKRANRLAHFLRSNICKVTNTEITDNTLIPICLPHGVNFVIAVLAVLKAGGAYIPINSHHINQRLLTVLEETRSHFILTEGSLVESIKNIKEDIFSICVDDNELIYQSSENLDLSISPNNLAYVMYTSGTTGKPKGVMVEQLGIISLVKNASYFTIRTHDTFAFFSDMAFDAATFEIFAPLLNGARLYIPESQAQTVLEPEKFKDSLIKNNISILWLTKSLFDIHFVTNPEVFSSLEYLIIGGEALTKSYMEGLCNSSSKPRHIINGYGPTENTTFSTTYSIDKHINHLASVPIGKPLSYRTAYVFNKHLQLQPIGAVGTLFVGGTGLGAGYYNQPELTSQRFIANPLYAKDKNVSERIFNTHDQVRWLPDGNLEYFGRLDDQIKLRGYRIELKDIEAQILRHPNIHQVFVMVKKNEGREYLILYYVASKPLKNLALRAFLMNLLPSYMIPNFFVYMERLPLTTNGKIDLKSLPLPVLNSQETTAQKLNSIEQMLEKIWRNILGLKSVDINAAFFEVGGDSLKIITLKQEIKKELSIELPVVDLFQYPTIFQLAKHIKKQFAVNEFNTLNLNLSDEDSISSQSKLEPIAIVGMACRLPGGVANAEDFWKLLLEEGTTLRTMSKEEIEARKQDFLEIASSFIGKSSVLEDSYKFDAQFFGYSAKEAELLDPQQRKFLECAWEALEQSGNVPEKLRGELGVFASQGKNRYYDEHIRSLQPLSEKAASYQEMICNEKDFLATRVSFKLNLTGPSITVQTGCSSSLVAVNMACDSLQSYQCDAALAGGVSIVFDEGYIYQEGMIESSDGYCRPFDASANGTVAGSGVGVVLLKRLSDAIAAKDTIYALIKGWAINNDGSDKISYTAPSVAGQFKVIQKALYKANLTPAQIDYVEAHGTATTLGDPIEVRALHQAYEPYFKDKAEKWELGSVKSNIGHTDAAAGVFGLIKATLILKNKVIPTTLHFKKFNPEIAVFNKIFNVVDHKKDFTHTTRTAAVSSFGVGGTNAHTILQNYEDYSYQMTESYIKSENDMFLIPLSAKTEQNLNVLMEKVASYLKICRVQDIPNIAFTAQQGRSEFLERGYFIVDISNGILKKYSSYPGIETRMDILRCFYILPDINKANGGYLDFHLKLIEALCKLNISIECFYGQSNSADISSLKYRLPLGIKLKNINEITEETNQAVWINATSIYSIRNPRKYLIPTKKSDYQYTWIDILGWLWTQGLNISWEKVFTFDKNVRKTSFPTYPFIGQNYCLPKSSLKLKGILQDSGSNITTQPSALFALKGIWSNILGVSTDLITLDINFFNLGGDSIAFIDLFHQVKQEFKLNISLDELIKYSIFGSMLDFICSKHTNILPQSVINLNRKEV